MRWVELFDDLEGQLAAQAAAEVRGEAAEHTRAAIGRVHLTERLLADLNLPVRIALRGGLTVEGALADVAPEWLVVHESSTVHTREVLVVTSSVLSISGLTGRSDIGRPARIGRSLDLRQALRALSRDRVLVRARDIDGGVTVGTIGRVGADHVDIGVHPDDLPARSRDVRAVVTIPYQALVCLVRN